MVVVIAIAIADATVKARSSSSSRSTSGRIEQLQGFGGLMESTEVMYCLENSPGISFLEDGAEEIVDSYYLGRF